MQNKQAVIIGSGIAGLAVAIRLASKGYRVNVYEKNENPGGKLSGIVNNEFNFDAGPSLFTQPKNIEELFSVAGESITDHFKYKPVDISCRYFFPDGKIINAFANPDNFASELQDKAGEKAETTKKYLYRAARLYDNIGNIFLSHSLHKKNTWFHSRILKAVTTLRLPYLFSTLASYNKKHFKTNEAQLIFNRFATYSGSNPYKAPAMLSLIAHLEHNEGIFYPLGGMISITNSLYKLAVDKGVTFSFNKAVDRIIHTEGRVKGVVVNNKNIYSDVVISNVDVFFTYRDLLGHQEKAKKLLKKERSSSAIIFYWGINDLHPELDLHNIFFTSNYKNEFDCIKNNVVCNDPTIYINITSKMEEGHAPAGKENWFVMINVPANTGQDWDAIKQRVRANILKKISTLLQKDIEPLIVSEESMDPISIEEKTGSFMGAIYGTSSNSRLAAFSRPANFTSYIKGLYFCGGSVHPGGGIPLCLKGASITADLIARKKNDHAA